jgi:hypothetical protein
LQTVRTGRSAFEHVFGMERYAYFAQHPSAAMLFEAGLASRTRAENRAVLASYAFEGTGTIVDVGGGQGGLLAAILEASPARRGILVELPAVAAQARRQLEQTGFAGRCAIVAGDFFREVPAGGDVYVLSKVLHNWDDPRAIAILQTCSRAMAGRGKILLVERVLGASNDPLAATLFDLQMLVQHPGGRERTVEEYRWLLAAAGLVLTQVIPTSSPVTLVEGVRDG